MVAGDIIDTIEASSLTGVPRLKFKLPKNSLFAILLRSRWWISFAIAGALALVAMALLPESFRAVGALSGFPFIVIGVLALRRQWRLPSDTEIVRAAQALSGLSWPKFNEMLEASLRADGQIPSPVRADAADLEYVSAGNRVLVCARRWKSARIGLEALRALDAARRERDATAAVYVGLGELTEPARRFAQQHGLAIWGAAELAHRLRAQLPRT